MKNLFSQIPSVDSILQNAEIEKLKIPKNVLVSEIRTELEKIREEIKSGEIPQHKINKYSLSTIAVENLTLKLKEKLQPSLTRVINATGVILHTGLGRAPFSEPAKKSILEVAENYSNLEFDIETGKRGDRISHVENLLTSLSGAESAVVVNNNAGAVLITLNTIAFGKEVVVSRGQLIEIGGGFRIPEVIVKSGAIMKEVGTTNKTHLYDFEKAINKNTALILQVHTSNYKILGFTKEVELKTLTGLAHKKKIPLVHDLGGGVLIDLRKFGLPYEPIVKESIESGADVVTFSGDKILGGPQAGIIVGKKKYIDRIKKNPLMRALRCDKLTYASLSATLKIFLDEKEILQKHSVLKMMTESIENLRKRAEFILNSIGENPNLEIQIKKSYSQAGSGALPLEKIPSVAIVISPKIISTNEIAKRLRKNQPPIIGYVKNDKLYLDLRTVREDEIPIIVKAIKETL
jgi:L-seryl-tRNA(Ser) seleniumtransferase